MHINHRTWSRQKAQPNQLAFPADYATIATEELRRTARTTHSRLQLEQAITRIWQLDISSKKRDEIKEARGSLEQTRRPTVPALEAILYEPFAVLDHGFIRVIDYMGDDTAVVQAARVSYGKGVKRKLDDVSLIRYLMKNRHTTPFEMAEIKLHIKLPIFVARQWVRHRTANINEISGRYSVLDREFYIPSAETVARQSKTNRQGRGDALSRHKADKVRELLRRESERAYENYQTLLGHGNLGDDQDHLDVARELARLSLTLNTYTEWYWKIDLHNLFNFLELRSDLHSQFEIRAYADVIMNVVKTWMPTCFEAFIEFRRDSITLSRQEARTLKLILKNEVITEGESGLTEREWMELTQRFGLPGMKRIGDSKDVDK